VWVLVTKLRASKTSQNCLYRYEWNSNLSVCIHTSYSCAAGDLPFESDREIFSYILLLKAVHSVDTTRICVPVLSVNGLLLVNFNCHNCRREKERILSNALNARRHEVACN